MAFRLTIDGVAIEVDTATEFREAMRIARARTIDSSIRHRGRLSREPEQVFQSQEERRALQGLLGAPNGIAREELARLLELKHLTSLKGVMSTWSKRAATSGKTFAGLLRREVTHREGRSSVVYRLTDEGRAYFNSEAELEAIA